MDNLLHVYGQRFHHADVVIAGRRDSLALLAKTIISALVSDEAESSDIAPFYVNDGEGFIVRVRVVDGDVDKLAVPYSDDYAAERRPKAIWP